MGCNLFYKFSFLLLFNLDIYTTFKQDLKQLFINFLDKGKKVGGKLFVEKLDFFSRFYVDFFSFFEVDFLHHHFTIYIHRLYLYLFGPNLDEKLDFVKKKFIHGQL